jgi:hypothetical protein
MALSDRCFITLDELKNYLNASTDSSAKDSWLESVIDLVCGVCEESCDTEIEPQELELILDGNGSKVLNLGRFIEDLSGSTDAAKLANLQSRDDSESDWEDLTDDMDNVEFDGRSIVLLSDDFFPLGRKNIRVKFDAGFDPIPASLKKVALEMCAMHYKQSNVGSGQLGQSSMSFGSGGSTTTGNLKDMEASWNAVFAEYLDEEDNANISTVYL